MKPLQIAFILAIVCAAGFVCYYLGKPDSYDVVFRRLEGSVPRSSIAFAERAQAGREPTFIGLVVATGVTNWPTLFRELGCSPAADKSKEASVEQIVWHHFKNHSGSQISSTTNGFVVWAGSLKRSPYYLSALVSATNAFIVLDRY